MNKKVLLLMILGLFFIIGIFLTINLMFKSQYNSYGVSHYLVVTIDNKVKDVYIGNLEGYDIYINRLNIKETNFRTIKAENLSIKEAIDKKIVSIDEWKKYAFLRKKESNKEILVFDNYKMVITSKRIVIEPVN